MAQAIPLTTGIGRAIGCDYIKSRNQLVYVESEGRISRIDMRTHGHSVLGVGYDHPEDVVVSADETRLYVTERCGTLLEVALETPDRAHARVLCDGLLSSHLLALDEVNGHAYLIEYGFPGRLLRIELAGGACTVLVAGLEGAIGLMMTRDLRYAYLSERASSHDGQVCRIDLETGRREMLVTDIHDTHYLSWLEMEPVTLVNGPAGAGVMSPVARVVQAQKRVGGQQVAA